MTETKRVPTRTSKALDPAVVAHKIGDIILDKKGCDLVVMDIESVATLGDFMVVATAKNTRQAQAIAQEIISATKALGVGRCDVEGAEQGWWVLLDCGDVIVHIMHEDARRYYNLEMLWSDARVVRRAASVA